jgi:ribosomal protein S18 acetylase RimI-like enzyme
MDDRIEVRRVAMPEDYGEAQALIEEYVGTLGFDLTFQDFDREIRNLEGAYRPPDSCILLATEDDIVLGCVALRPFENGICEMKRLYVRPAGRGRGIGRRLAEAVIEEARRVGYATMRLDTIGTMHAANTLYRSLGFREIPAYRENPIDGARFFELSL